MLKKDMLKLHEAIQEIKVDKDIVTYKFKDMANIIGHNNGNRLRAELIDINLKYNGLFGLYYTNDKIEDYSDFTFNYSWHRLDMTCKELKEEIKKEDRDLIRKRITLFIAGVGLFLTDLALYLNYSTSKNQLNLEKRIEAVEQSVKIKTGK